MPGFGALGLQSWVRNPMIGFLGLDSWLLIPGFRFLGLDSRVWSPGLGFLGLDSWVWSPWVWNPGLEFLDLDSWPEPTARSDYTYDLEPSVAILKHLGVNLLSYFLSATNAWICTRKSLFDALDGRWYRN